MQLLWDVTNTCNQRCRHCYNSQFINQRQRPDWPWTEALHQRLKSFMALNDVHLVTLAGGEPFTRRDIFRIIDALACDATVSITTNATLITKAVAGEIAQAPLAKVAVSLESAMPDIYNANRGEGFFERFRAGLARLSEARSAGASRFWLELSVTIVPWCLREEPDIAAVFQLARQTGCDGVCYQFPNSAGVGWEHLADSQYLVRIARIIAQLSQQYLDIITTLQYKKCLVDYCNQSLGADLLGGKTLCPAGSEIVYMDNQLLLFPCIYHNGSQQTKRRIAKVLGWQQHNDANHLLHIGRVDRCPLFLRFDALKRKIAATAYPACRGCLSASQCYKICPYDYILNRRVATRNIAGVCRLIRSDALANHESAAEMVQALEQDDRLAHRDSACP